MKEPAVNNEYISSFLDNMVPGCYAVSVTGKLPMHIIRELKARGIDYIPRDRSQQL